MKGVAKTISKYNSMQKKVAGEICCILEIEINKILKSSKAKIWHGAPVWFIDGNPVVSYSVRKNGSVSLLFFSGQSFEEEQLKQNGKFKAAEIFYSDYKEIKLAHLKRWLKKSQIIQWDYKNIIKNKGKLSRVVI